MEGLDEPLYFYGIPAIGTLGSMSAIPFSLDFLKKNKHPLFGRAFICFLYGLACQVGWARLLSQLYADLASRC
jgi:hypothetical protein